MAAPVSHPPLRPTPPVSNRPATSGPGYYVNPTTGDDKANGSKASPWKTAAHALSQLKPGDRLYLHGGVHYGPLYVACAGRADAPITIRSVPGEQAIIDGSMREFFENPADAWEPVAAGSDEYRSKRVYLNLRHVIGSFGDSMIGLNTYYHAKDLRSTSELDDWEDWNKVAETDSKPLYCGPGVWYDRETGRIHVRLAHTHLPEPAQNYRGDTDPRKLPLILAPFGSVPMNLDGAEHLRIQDLIVRGGGYTAVNMTQAKHVEFDNVTIWATTYGMRMNSTEHLRMIGSRIHGSVPPWTFRSDASKRDYPGKPYRNITRLNTHCLIEIEGGNESSVYAYPQNDFWEFAYCEFTDAHDGIYFGSVNVKYHHNRMDGMQDDGIYLSPMYHRHRLEKTVPQIHIYQNTFGLCYTALAWGGPQTSDDDNVFIYRNVFDLSGKIMVGRPSTRDKSVRTATANLLGTHGSPPWAALNLYHNTVIATDRRDPTAGAINGLRGGHPRRIFNNIFYHTDKLPAFGPPRVPGDLVIDADLYWAPGTSPATAKTYFDKFRKTDTFTASLKVYPEGSTKHSLVADPLFEGPKNFHLKSNSPAKDAGVPIPAEWPDPLREADGKPDIGAFPVGSGPLLVGPEARPAMGK